MSNMHINSFAGRHVHLIGIGGISMSGLAEILKMKGFTVSGSDLKHTSITERLRQNDIKVYIGHSAENVKDADLVVYTAAVKEDNPELIETKRQGIPTIDRASLLGQIMESYKYSVGIAGTHGKTTTTSMLSIILDKAGLDPTILVGGELDAIGGNVRIGRSPYFVTEACEYVGSFLKSRPYMAVILNIDMDHVDYFKDIEHVYETFLEYARLVPETGYLIGCNDDPRVKRIMGEVRCRTVSFGLEPGADWNAWDIGYDEMGCASFDMIRHGLSIGKCMLKIPGRHNILNALAAAAAASTIGVPDDTIVGSLLDFKGTHRRFEVKGRTEKGAVVIDDYAHHPTEIKATIKAALNYPHKQIWCVFQPHTYTRTKKLFNEFTEAFWGIDHLVLADIYAARETNTEGIHSKDLADTIRRKGMDCVYIDGFDGIAGYLKDNAQAGDLVMTMGAGDIFRVADAIIE